MAWLETQHISLFYAMFIFVIKYLMEDESQYAGAV